MVKLIVGTTDDMIMPSTAGSIFECANRLSSSMPYSSLLLVLSVDMRQ